MGNPSELAELVRQEDIAQQPLPYHMRQRAPEATGKINVLIVGSGAREHAFLWAFKKSPIAGEIYLAPGNGGTAYHNVDIKADDIHGLLHFAMEHNCFTFPSPELPLALGIVDRFADRGMLIFGPTHKQSKLEWSKSYSKQFMRDNRIPTSDFAVFTDSRSAIEYAATRNWNVAVKADGPAGGHGVFMCSSEDEVRSAVTEIMEKRLFGKSGDTIVVEDRIAGQEISMFAICDGKNAVYIGSAVDYKRLLAGDKGPNTGSMGAYSPTERATPELVNYVMHNIADVVVKRTGYKGFLYMGMMLTRNGPMVLEFNARFGDPEAQVILPRLRFDLLTEMYSISKGNDVSIRPHMAFNDRHALTMSMCSEGYPFSHGDRQGREITFMGDDAHEFEDTIVFHAGTKRRKDGSLVTDGGRVLSITGIGKDREEARMSACKGVFRIHFSGEQHRNDIGLPERVPPTRMRQR